MKTQTDYAVSNSFLRTISNKIRLRLNLSYIELFNTIVVRFLVLGINFIATTLITRNLSVEDRGKYAYLLNGIYLLMTFLSLGFHSSIVYILSKNRLYFSYLYTLSFLISVSSLLLLSILSYSGLIQFLCPRFNTLDIFILVLSVPLVLFNYFNSFFFISINNFRQYNSYEFVKNFVFLLLTLAFFTTMPRYEYYLVFFVIGNLVYVLASFYQFYRHRYIKISISFILRNRSKFFALLSKSINIASISYVSCILSFMLSKYILFFLGSFLSINLKTLGYYSVALSNIDILMILPTTLAFYIFPKISAVDCMREKIAIVNRMILLCVVFFGAAGVFSFLFLNDLFALLYGKVYLEAVPMFQLLLPSAFFLSVISCISSFIGGIGMQRTAIYAPLCALIFMACCSFALKALVFDVYNFIYLQNIAYFVYFLIYIRYFLNKWKAN